LRWHCSIALLLSALSAASALACTPPPGGLPVFTIAQRVQAADVVLEGTVAQMSAINFQNDTATITVQRYFKSTGPASVTITNFGPGSLCRSFVQVGGHWIFFAKGDPSALMSASYLSQFDAIAAPSADTIAQIIAALNIRPRTYLPLLVGGGVVNIVAGAPSSKSDGMTIGEMLLLVVGALWLWQRFLTSRI
jgi:hypothetical protein